MVVVVRKDSAGGIQVPRGCPSWPPGAEHRALPGPGNKLHETAFTCWPPLGTSA